MSDGMDGRLWIGNARVDAASGRTLDTLNPATGESMASVAEGAEADIGRAVAEARSALVSPEWRGMDAHRRAEILWRLSDLIEEHADELGEMETRDNGKPIFESRQVDLPQRGGELPLLRRAGEQDPGRDHSGQRPVPELHPAGAGGRGGVHRALELPALPGHVEGGSGLACGNTVVLKPAEETPLTALRLGELAAEAGLPTGVLNVVPGFGETAGAALVRHPGVDAIAFTGSTEVGKIVMREAADTLKRVLAGAGR